jgi:predicted nucleic acid-binding protein
VTLGLTLDTGALIAIERRDRRVAGLVEATRRRGARVTVPTPVVAEWWRGQRGPVARLLDAFDVEGLDRELSEVAGLALAAISGSGTIDAIVMASAARRGDSVLTADFEDLDRLRAYFPNVRILTVGK